MADESDNNEIALEMIMLIMTNNDVHKIIECGQKLQQLRIQPFEDDGYPRDDDDDEDGYPYWVLFFGRLLALFKKHSSNAEFRESILSLLIHLFITNEWQLNIHWNDHHEMDDLIDLMITTCCDARIKLNIRRNCIKIITKIVQYEGEMDQRYYLVSKSSLLSTFIRICEPQTDNTVLGSVAECMYKIVSVVSDGRYFAQRLTPTEDAVTSGYRYLENVLLILNKLLLARQDSYDVLSIVLLSYCEIFRQFKYYPIRYPVPLVSRTVSDRRLDTLITDLDSYLPQQFIESYLNGKSRSKKIRTLNKAYHVITKKIVNERVKVGWLMDIVEQKIDTRVHKEILVSAMNAARPEIPHGVNSIILSYSFDTSPYVLMIHLMQHVLGEISENATAALCCLIDCKEMDVTKLFDNGLQDVVNAIIDKAERDVPLEIGYIFLKWLQISRTSLSKEMITRCTSKLNNKTKLKIWQNISFGHPGDIENSVAAKICSIELKCDD